MNPPRLFLTLKRIGTAYFILIKNVLFLLLFVGAVAATGFAISYPLWIFATRSQKGYSITALAVLACGLAAIIILRLYRTGKTLQGRRYTNKQRIARGFLYTGSVIGFVILLYLVVFLFTQSMLLYGILLLILFLFFLGLFLYDITKKRA